jgi:two-component system nitrate/nitrite response regulator NarL
MRSVLQSQGHTVIGSCASLDQIVLDSEPQSPPDLFVVSGYGCEHSAELSSIISEMRVRMPATKWIVVGPDADSILLREALAAGADGLLFDEAPAEVFRLVTSLVLLGHSFIPTPLAQVLSQHSSVRADRGNVPAPDALPCGDDEPAASEVHVNPSGLNSPANRPRGVTGAPESRMDFDLSCQQWEILYWLVLGATNKHIAETFDMTTNQVKVQMRVIFRKMNVSNRSQAAIKALRYPTVPPGAGS